MGSCRPGSSHCDLGRLQAVCPRINCCARRIQVLVAVALTLGLVCVVPGSVVAILRCVGRDCAPRYMAWGIEYGRRRVDW